MAAVTSALRGRGLAILMGLLFVGLLGSLALLSGVAQRPDELAPYALWLLLFNGLGALVLVGLIAVNIGAVIRDLRRGRPGARLTTRLVLVFVVLAIVPMSVVYGFSVKALKGGIDSWFDMKTEGALDSALALARSALERQQQAAVERTEAVLVEGAHMAAIAGAVAAEALAERLGADSVRVFDATGQLVAATGASPIAGAGRTAGEAPAPPLPLGSGAQVSLEPTRDGGLMIRVWHPLEPGRMTRAPGLLEARFAVDDRISTLSQALEVTVNRYRELAYLREPLVLSFVVTLSLALLLSLLAAVWTAFYAAGRLVAPVRDLARATEAIAAGDYSAHVAVKSGDELAFLAQSFNTMTARVASAQESARVSQVRLAGQHAYLETVLERISSGVLTLEAGTRVRTANGKAEQILELPLSAFRGAPVADLAGAATRLTEFCQAIEAHCLQREEWQTQVRLHGADGALKVLMCRGAWLPSSEGGHEECGGGHASGSVIVLDDVTALIQAQRDAAWGEVARRLAHEIKNPLTPIQLAAERLRHKYLSRLPEADGGVLDRSTTIIINQVEALKGMVRDFADYARGPRTAFVLVDINALVQEIHDLYRAREDGLELELDLAPGLPAIQADAARLRQLLHNLVKNALEAVCANAHGWIRLATRSWAGAPAAGVHVRTGGDRDASSGVEIVIEDNGVGIPSGLAETLFEPYVTNKPKGTGLGLAIVRKIVDEHGGAVWAENRASSGARVVVRLPTRIPPEAVERLGQAREPRAIAYDAQSRTPMASVHDAVRPARTLRPISSRGSFGGEVPRCISSGEGQ